VNTNHTTVSPLEELFLDELADMYDAETNLVRTLPKMARSATHADLQAAFESHLRETQGHVEKLKKVFETFGRTAKPKKCEAMAGLIQEADKIAADHKATVALDAALISAAQKLEHYEMASYGSLREWAGLLGNATAADLLQEILEEEKTADQTLTQLGRAHCNNEALGRNGALKNASDEEADENAPRNVSDARAARRI